MALLCCATTLSSSPDVCVPPLHACFHSLHGSFCFAPNTSATCAVSWAAPCCCEPLLPVLHRAVHCRAFAGCFLGQHCCFWTSSPGTEWGWLSEALLNLVVMISLFFHRCTFSVTKPSACVYYYCKLTDKASQLEQNIKLIASCSKCFEENAAHEMFLLLVPFSSCQHLGALEDVFFPGLQSSPVLL